MADTEVRVGLTPDKQSVRETFDVIVREGDKASKKSGESFGKNFTSSISNSVGNLARTLFNPLNAAVATFAGALSGAFAVGEAVKQQNAINQVATALRLSGESVKAVLPEFEKFASTLQDTSTIGDDAALQLLALAKNYGLSNEQAKQAVQIAADLNASLGLDTQTALRGTALAIQGNGIALTRYIPQLKGVSGEALKAGKAIEILGQFAGAAQARLLTFSGASESLKNRIGDVAEEFGGLITKSPTLIAAINVVDRLFKDLASNLASRFQGVDIFAPILDGALRFVQFFNANILPTFAGFVGFLGSIFNTIFNLTVTSFSAIGNALAPIFGSIQKNGSDAFLLISQAIGVTASVIGNIVELISSAINVGINAVIAALNFLVATAGNKVGQVADLLNSVGLDNSLTQGLQTFRESSAEVFNESFGALETSIAEQKPKVIDALSTFFSDANTALVESSAEFNATKNATFDLAQALNIEGAILQIQERAPEISKALGDVSESTSANIKQAGADVKTSTDGIAKNVNQVGQALQNFATKGISGAIQRITEGLANGKFSFQDFTAFVLNLIGELAIQIGETTIAASAAISALGQLSPAAGFVAGAALIAIGTLIKSFASSQGAAGGGAGGVGAGSADSFGNSGAGFANNPDATLVDAEEERELERPVINLTVNGSIMDGDETGLRIVDLLNQAFEKDGVVLNQAVV